MDELKEFINLKIDSLVTQVQHLSSLVESQASALRTIELTTTNRLTEVRKDLDNAFEELRSIKEAQNKQADSQKFRWRSLGDERKKEQEEMAKRWETQTEINQGIKTMTKLLWAIGTIVLGLAMGFVWQLIISGGLRGMIGGAAP